MPQNDIVAGGQAPADIGPERQSLADWLYAAPALLGRHIALLAAWVATGGSLFMSEVLGWIPCLLCWYQRILMYPLAVILLVGILRRDRGLHWYVLPLSLGGAVVALYHYLLVMTDWFPAPPCNTGVPCTVDYINLAGALSFVKVPFLALVAFLIISVFTGFWALYQAEQEALAAEEGEALPAAPRRRALGVAGVAAIAIAAGVTAVYVIAGQIT
jgi:disulfide bond formation protein DsbB